jgi:2-polyprenyl-3-methyl-5-hydroxy-6-metoxy-1,4-benzoquinol methylase
VTLRGEDRLLSLPGSFDVRECTGCGLGVTDPRLTGETLARHYPRSYEPYQEHGSPATARAIARMRDIHMMLRLLRPALAELAARPPGRLLDVGCGRGELASAFARRGWTAAGVDPSPDAVRVARSLGVDAREGTLDDVAWDLASFDALVLHHALEHVPDPVATLCRAGELLRPGGWLFVAVPYWGSWQRRRFGSRWFHLDVPRHLQHFDEVSLTTAVRAAELVPRRAWVVVSTVGLLGSLQYAVFGRCVFGGALTLPGQAIAIALRPVTVAAGHLLGGDCLDLVAQRPV